MQNLFYVVSFDIIVYLPIFKFKGKNFSFILSGFLFLIFKVSYVYVKY